ncbi:MAG: serine/threonine-protein kinase [Planctomycetota bacterium]|nr:serine/threonine-protein kinase [Planctomycetota bacterium]MDA1251037.1 serine/threonine-protein kinase [Planctomycetota bacterium]
MIPASVESFVALLEQSHLLDEKAMAEVRRLLPPLAGQTAPGPFASEMVGRGEVTKWQAEKLLAGHQAFFLGRYKLMKPLGQGGMGTVFLAEQQGFGRLVALKILDRKFSSDPASVARFEREIQAIAALQHPNIVGAYDAGCVGNCHFLVMEFVDGEDLGEILKRQPVIPVSIAADYVRQATLGLQYVHEKGTVHRDIKPSNLFVSVKAGQPAVVKILDLGLARFSSAAGEGGELTHTGQIMGTPDYISPEQALDSKSADIRADIFSLGCTLYRALTGQLPFAGNNVMEKLLARSQTKATPVSALRPEIDAGLSALVEKMLARNPDDRPQTPGEIAEALIPFLRSEDAATELVSPGESTSVAFRSAKGRSFAERKTTMTPENSSPVRSPSAKLAAESRATVVVPPALPAVAPRPEAARVNSEFDQFLSNLTSEEARADPTPERGPAALVARTGNAEPPTNGNDRKPRQVIYWVSGLLTVAAVAVVGVFLAIANQARARLHFEWPEDERAGSQLQINDRDIAVARAGEIHFEFDAGGRFEIVARRPGFERFEKTLQIRRGDAKSIKPIWIPTESKRREQEFAELQSKVEQLRPPGDAAQRIPINEDSTRMKAEIRDFQWKYPVTTEANEAAHLASRFEWPVDSLSRDRITPEQRLLAGNGDPSRVPPEIVAIFGSGRQMHYLNILAVTFSPDGRFVANSSAEHSVRVWDAKTGDLVRAFNVPGLEAEALAFSPDSRRLVAALRDRFGIWNTDTWESEGTLEAAGQRNFSLRFDSKGKLYAVGEGVQISVWDLDGKKLLQQFQGGAPRLQFAVSPDEKLIAAGGQDGEVSLFSIDGQKLGGVSIRFPVQGVWLIKEGRTLVTAGSDSGIRQWNVSDPANPVPGIHFQTQKSRLAISKDGSRLYASGENIGDPTAWVFDLETGEAIGKIGDDSTTVARALRISPDGSTLLTTSFGGFRFWDVASGKEKFASKREPQCHLDRIADIDVSPDGSTLVSTALDMTILERDLATGQVQRRHRGSPSELAGGVACHPREKKFVFGDGSRLVSVDQKSGAGVPLKDTVQGPFERIQYSLGGRHIFASTTDGRLCLWDVLTGKLERTVSPDAARHFDLRSDGLLATFSSSRSTISVYSQNGARHLADLDPQREQGGAVAWSPHGNLLAVAQFGEGAYHIDIWNIDERRRIRTVGSHQGWLFSSLAFSPDGRFLAGVRGEGKLEVWDLSRNSTYPEADIPVGGFGFICARLRFTPDGRHVVTGNGNGTIYVVRLPEKLFD